MILLRLDDVGMDQEQFNIMHGMLQELNLPCTYAVVPHYLNKALAKQITNPKIECIIHGYRHENHSKEEKSEFPNSRSYEEQLNDLTKSKQLFNKFLPNQKDYIFTPPWHHMNEDTAKALKELNFTHLSLSRLEEQRIEGNLAKQFQTTFLQIVYDPNTEDDIPNLLKKLIASAKINYAGIILHHNLLTNQEAISNTKRFLTLLKKAASTFNLEFKTLSQVT